MPRIALLVAGSAALALAGCGGADEPDGDTTVIETETVERAPAPTVTETTTVIDNDADGVTISEDGVDAEISDGDTRVTVDADENPSVRVQD